MSGIKKMKNNGKLNIRDFITIGIMLVLIFLVYSLGAPIGFTPIGYLFLYAVCSLFWGTLFLLLYTKVNKKGVPLIVTAVLSLIMMILFGPTSIIMFAGGILAEVIWRKFDRKKTNTMIIVYGVQVVAWFLATMIPLLLLKESFLTAMPEYAELFEGLYSLLAGPMFFAGFIGTIIGIVLGGLIGKKLLKKHFIKAGIV